MELSLPWDDDGDPPDHALRTAVVSLRDTRFSEPDFDMKGDSPQLDLGLTGITEFSSYSKLWRLLEVVHMCAWCCNLELVTHCKFEADRIKYL